MASLATAFVAIVPSLEGFRERLKAELDPAVSSAGTEAGDKAGGFFSKALKGTLAVGAVAAGAAVAGVGATLTAGFGRLEGIERARNLLSGVGNDAETVEAVMGDALASVKGTAFGLEEAALVAANSVAAGVQPGKDLENQLKLVADIATITGSSMGEIGDIMGTMTATGKVTNNELQMLATRGIPVYQYLADEMGTSVEAVTEMASNGDISLQQLSTSLETNLGGAALKAGETSQGAFANVQAAVSRVGANILSGTFSQLPGFFTSIIDSLGPLEETAKEIGAELGDTMAPVFASLAELLPSLLESLLPLAPALIEIAAGLGEAFISIMPMVIELLTVLIPVIADLVPSFLEMLPVVQELAAIFLDLASAVLPVLVNIVSGVVSALANVFTWIMANRTELLGWLIALGTFVAVMNAAKIAAVAFTAVTKIMSVVTKIAQGIQLAFNLIMMANPIMLVVAAIAALVAGLVYFFTQTEAGKEAWAAFTGFLSDLWNGITIAFQMLLEEFAALWEWFKGVPGMIMDALTAAGDFLVEIGKNILQGLWDGILFVWELIKFWYIDLPQIILGLLASAGQWLLDTGQQILQGLFEGIVAGALIVWDWMGKLGDVIIGFFVSAGQWLLSAGEWILDGLWTGIKNIWEFIKWWFLDMPGVVADLFSDAGTWLLQAGKDIMSGLWDGLKDMAKNVWNWMKDWGSSWVKSVKDMFKIKSPSQVFEEIGSALGEGLLVGMENMEADVNSQVNSMVRIPAMPNDGVGRIPVINYYAAPNKSFDAQQELLLAMRRVSVMAG